VIGGAMGRAMRDLWRGHLPPHRGAAVQCGGPDRVPWPPGG